MGTGVRIVPGGTLALSLTACGSGFALRPALLYTESMEKGTAERLARTLIEDHLPGQGWKFAWDRAVSRFGLCDYDKRTISLSLPVTVRSDESDVRDTLLHEIAHALAGPSAKHGPAWRAVARSIGATPVASADGPNLRPELAPWVGTCPAGHESPRRYFRKPRQNYSCRQCGPKWDAAHLITYRKVDVSAATV